MTPDRKVSKAKRRKRSSADVPPKIDATKALNHHDSEFSHGHHKALTVGKIIASSGLLTLGVLMATHSIHLTKERNNLRSLQRRYIQNRIRQFEVNLEIASIIDRLLEEKPSDN